ncbi:hypothetical protein ILUMI_24279 [Ignelater luminosus]|uniref:Fatty acyl-CoA reductase n=1 Tax=Ignelater luminosus TaxID=2038154 RepID=A0A8K0CCA2_IGNLU|nr:hypothetical protein ILUMI_24279 [Ignelater luminosus]
MVATFEREGDDITVSDMVIPEAEASQIEKYFSGSTVFLTGGTGFLGKLITEKLLRTCRGVKRIYLMIRSKKDKTIEKRLEELVDNVLWERLRKEQPNFIEKIVLVNGDCTLSNLGLSDEDRQKLINEVNCVFHCAATVRFDEKIRSATHINIRATRDILLLSKEIKNLKSFVYVSTAFSNCIRKEINEEFYEPTISGDKLITLVDTLNEEMLDSILPTILGQWPNTYALTKAVAEEVVKSYSDGLPIAIVRPAIVISTVKEPVAGWIDNIYGATGVLVGAALGVIRTLQCDKNCRAEIVPADYVINCCISAAWDIGTTKKSNKIKELTFDDKQNDKKKEDEVQIYNYVCSPEKPIRWKDFMMLAEKYLKQIPSPLLIWHYCFIITPNYYLHMLLIILLHRVPAYTIDFFAKCIGREPMLVKGYKKIDKFLRVLAYFATQEWHFQNKNTQALWRKLNETDKKSFEFSLDLLDWDAFFSTYARGGRVYLCKDPMESLPQGRIKYRNLQIAHYTLCMVLLFIFVRFIIFLWHCFV